MRVLFASLFGVLFFAPCIAAEIKSVVGKDARALIIISGELAIGDSEIFKAAVKSANDAGKVVANIRLNSIGGNLGEGVKLADAVRFAKISTNVGKDATCASACFLVFAAGATKFASYSAQIGVHGASTVGGAETGDGTVAMARVARELGVPPSIIGRMVVTPPSEMVWLSPHDLQSMGTTMVGKPAQVATDQIPSVAPRQTRPGEPLNLDRNNASSNGAPSWDSIVSKAVDASAAQNNGRAKYLRTCQPELKICISGVSLKTRDGLLMLLKVTKDMHDKVVRREVCEFNQAQDIRKCFDWDKNSVRRDMKGSDGEWVKVADQ